jgi:hypothetical protein
MDAKPFGNATKILIVGPQESRRFEKHGSNQVGIDEANADCMQAAYLYRKPQFACLRHSDLRQKIQQSKRLAAFLKRTERKLRNHKRMNRNLPAVQPFAHLFVTGAEMIDPN